MMQAIISIIKWLFSPLGFVHILIVWLRNKSYDWRQRQQHVLPRPVISVGNIQMGGTGKTVLVIELLEKLQARGLRVGVLTRGYKRRTKENRILLPGDAAKYRDIGDEPAMLLPYLKNGAIGVGKNRYKTGMKILEKYPVDLFLLDDGLQRRALFRDVDICLIDVSRWSNHPFLFPFSKLRDNKSSLKRVGAIILTKFDRCPEQAEKLAQKFSARYEIPVFKAAFEPRRFVRLSDGQKVEYREILFTKIAAICGIANPQNFWDLLARLKIKPVFQQRFSDHYHYKTKEIESVLKRMQHLGARRLIVTEKDAIKIRECLAGKPELQQMILVLSVRFAFEDEAKWTQWFDAGRKCL